MSDDFSQLWRRQNSTTLDEPDLSLGPSPDDIASQARYARLIALHGLVGFFGLAVICPLAICIVSIGKAHGPKAAMLHKKLQVYIVVPSLIVCVTLGYAAGIVSPKETPLDSHKVFGLVMIASIAIALATGSYAHDKYFSPKAEKPRKKARPMSIFLHTQAGLGFLISPATQVLSGLAEWQTHVGSPLPWFVPIVAWSTLAFFPSLLLLHWLVRGIYRMSSQGKSFRLAFFPPSTPREAVEDPESRSLRDNCFDVDVEEHKGERPRLKAIPTLDFHYRRGTQDRTPGSPRSVSSPAAASFSSSSDSRGTGRSPPPPFSPPRGRMSPV
ncbi:uncharacterized protein JCM6883_005686 [Sporobolomyces salmoneus]|uniref:uncharacterized protein n=1 Tax=Sporobolomyces salmoneus TaxID=183962 RepID=UPI00317F097E